MQEQMIILRNRSLLRNYLRVSVSPRGDLRLCRAERQIESSVFENGGLKIDYTAGCTYLKGEELHLTPIEYKLLCLLSRQWWERY